MQILLPLAIVFKGSCHGIIAIQVERTDTEALFKRSDGYFECFYINETSHNIFQDGTWMKTGDTVERYPSDERFGASAWCGREKTIRELYERLNAVSDQNISKE